jgi:hypothetical protein
MATILVRETFCKILTLHILLPCEYSISAIQIMPKEFYLAYHAQKHNACDVKKISLRLSDV